MGHSVPSYHTLNAGSVMPALSVLLAILMTHCCGFMLAERPKGRARTHCLSGLSVMTSAESTGKGGFMHLAIL